MDLEGYLSRIGLEESDVQDTDIETLEKLQQAHLRNVPFETLSVSGSPFGDSQPEGVSLDVSDLYEKIVENQRGGFCYELNGLFKWLLEECGFDVEYLAARVVSPEDGSLGPPGDHQPLLVSLDEDYMADVGFGGDVIRYPLPFDGMPRGGTGGQWRLSETDRRDADYTAQSRGFNGEDWEDRFIFRKSPRDATYFEPAFEYHQLSPDATFTDWALVTMATETGHKTLMEDSFVETESGERHERSVSEEEWRDILENEFGIEYQPA